MSTSDRKTMRVAFQGEPGAFSEAAAIQLLGDAITTVPRATFDAAFRAIDEDAADAFLAPVENTLAGSVVRVYDLLLESRLTIVAETMLPIPWLSRNANASFPPIRSGSAFPPKTPPAASVKRLPEGTSLPPPLPGAAPPSTTRA